MTLRVGVHPNNLHLTLAQHWGAKPSDPDMTFVPYPEGRSTGQWLADDKIDVGGTGSTPPIISQVAGLDVRYIAASAPRPANGAILVRGDSSIVKISDLVGRKIALLDGSFHTYLLACVLDEAVAKLKTVTRVELPPAESWKALEGGRVDAWIAMAPHLDQALASGRVRQLAACGAHIPNRSVFWTVGPRGLTRRQIESFVHYLTALGQDIAANVDKAAGILADLKVGNADIASWRTALASRDWTIVPAGAGIVAEQQHEADTLFRHDELKRRIAIRAALPLSSAAA